jgi:hypothetical protein
VVARWLATTIKRNGVYPDGWRRLRPKVIAIEAGDFSSAKAY